MPNSTEAAPAGRCEHAGASRSLGSFILSCIHSFRWVLSASLALCKCWVTVVSQTHPASRSLPSGKGLRFKPRHKTDRYKLQFGNTMKDKEAGLTTRCPPRESDTGVEIWRMSGVILAKGGGSGAG